MSGAAFTASFGLVFLKAVQQQNVIHKDYKLAAFNAFLLAACEIGVILSAVEYGWDVVPYIGAGGALGVCLAMYFYPMIQKVFKK